MLDKGWPWRYLYSADVLAAQGTAMRQSVADLEGLISTHAVTMAQALLATAQAAGSEEDVRHACNALIDDFIAKAGLEVKGRHEYAIGGGRLDSKYQGVLLEYKHPKGPQRITDDPEAPGTRKVVAQIKQRMADFERDEGYRPERLLGVGCDGDSLVYVRYRSGRWDVEAPRPVTRHSVERLLRALVSLGAQGHSFTPERLAEDFGAEGSLAASAIAALYRAITQTRSRKAKMFFNQWKLLFGEVCGYDIEGKNPKVARLASHYHVAGGEPAPLLFAVHTYYAILMKFLAAEIASTFSPLGTSVLKKCAGAASNAQLRREMAQLEQGGIWTQLGISNFLEGDLFSWYLAAWSDDVAEAVRSIASKLDDYDPATLSVEPAESRDLLKKLYQQLFPKSVRHDLGEYYTPDWLAEHVLNELGYEGDPDKRLLDPACGSGTFLVIAINRIKQWFEQHAHECGFGEKELIAKVQSNVIGFDLNPLAVMAARTNYLLAVRDLLRFAPRLEIPVYLCDSIMTPAEHGELFAGKGARKLRTAAGEFIIPGEIATDRERVARYAESIEFCVRNQFTADDFLVRCEEDGLPVVEGHLHRELYEQLRALEADDQNGIWARIIKNAFAPLFVGRVDFVAGNPPWVNWEHLPGEYRDSVKPLWEKYGLFTLSPTAARLGGGKKDLSMLFTYSAVDNYLVDGGRLGFVITQTVFKTKGAGDGFRRLGFGKGTERVVLKPVCVHDLSDLQPFEAATNRTAVFVCERRRRPFHFPVPYIAWRKTSAFRREAPLAQALGACERREMRAFPVDRQVSTSPWLTAPPKALAGIRKVLGRSDYQASAGCCTWLNGVYWVRIIQELPEGHVLVQNLHRAGKIKVAHVRWTVEGDLVYPLLRGRDVVRWRAEPVAHVLLVQDPQKRCGIPEGTMRRLYPRTFAYLKQFESQLRMRSGYRKYYQSSAPFYSMYDVSQATLAPWKVVWRDMGETIQAAVVDKPHCRPIVPEHHVMMVPFNEARPAYYLAGVLGSAPAKLAVACYTLTTGISAHVLEHIAVPAFLPSNPLHLRLAELSRQCHAACAGKDAGKLGTLEAQVDEAAAELWGITAAELRAIQAALREA